MLYRRNADGHLCEILTVS